MTIQNVEKVSVLFQPADGQLPGGVAAADLVGLHLRHHGLHLGRGVCDQLQHDTLPTQSGH